MSGQSIAQVLGASTTIAAITLLPNTGQDMFSFVLPTVTLLIVAVTVGTRLVKIALLQRQ